MSRPPTSSQLEQLARVAGEEHRDAVQAQGWNVAEGAEEGEDLPLAESQVNEGANDLAKATSALLAYARAPDAAALARYQDGLTVGRERWNEGIAQLWFLAHETNPPTI